MGNAHHELEYQLINKPNFVDKCVITVFLDGKILLNWSGYVYGHYVGEDGFFLSMRAAKMYVTFSGLAKWLNPNLNRVTKL
jgi:hypothetical protein